MSGKGNNIHEDHEYESTTITNRGVENFEP